MEIEVDADTIDEIALSFKGLNEFQIRQILTLAYQDGGCITRGDKALILKEKEQFIKKSGMLEIVNFSESIEDIGGLENLKDWLYRKAFIFRELDKAIKFGVDVPKGIMIIGMPGCGKSLTAKATASLFEIPLVRLDVGRLLGKYVGESEENMRNALKLSEAISPCVLWIDEIEKAFAGVGGEGGGNDVTTRLFGQFLTWMQEKENTVFIVATANDISRLPPEFLRKGRFDELFFVDLPNGTERRKILEIHLKKRKKWNENIDSIALIKETEGYNGADLEAVVKDTIERAFIEGRTTITTADLIRSIKDTKSISCTLKDKIASIQKTVEKIDIKPASLDDKKEKEPDPSQAYVKAAKAKAEPNPWRACAEAAKVIAEPGVRTAASVTSAKCGIYAKMFGELTKEQKGKQQ
jgi:SpoVK/Ycf46/Vps4 family AAA+-type ATPase